MKVIVCGAGQVGFNIARYLAQEDNDVTVIDQSLDLVQRISDTLDVRGVVGMASFPDVLEQAGAEDAEVLIAVTGADEVNMVACEVAHTLFGVPTKIARVRRQNYLARAWGDLFSRNGIPIDVTISPELEVARAVTRRLQLPGAFETIPLVDDKIKLIGVRCGDDCPLIHTPLRQLTQLFPDLNIVVVCIARQGKPIVPTPDDQMLAGDEVYFVVETEKIGRAMAAFGHEETEARRLLIFGGGNIGFSLAREIEDNNPWVNAKLIESDPEKAESAAKRLSRTVVLQGDVLDAEILEEANVGLTETVVAVTNDDETNILSSLLAKHSGCQRTIVLVNKAAYEPLITTLGIDVVVVPRNITVSTILQHVRRGRVYSAHTLREGFGELMEIEAMETSTVVGTPMRDLNLPLGVVIGALERKGRIIFPHPDVAIEAKDRVVVFAASEIVRKVEKLFAVSLGYF